VEMTQGRKAYLIAASPAPERSTLVRAVRSWLRVTERPVSADVSQVNAAEFVVDCDVDNQVAATAEVDVLEHQISPPHFVVELLHGGDDAQLSVCMAGWYSRGRVTPG